MTGRTSFASLGESEFYVLCRSYAASAGDLKVFGVESSGNCFSITCEYHNNGLYVFNCNIICVRIVAVWCQKT